METFIKECGIKVLNMVKDFINILMEIDIKETLIKEQGMEKV